MDEPTLAQIERDAIEQRIRDKGGNITHAAKSLDVDPRTIQRKRRAWIVLDNSGKIPQCGASMSL